MWQNSWTQTSNSIFICMIMRGLSPFAIEAESKCPHQTPLVLLQISQQFAKLNIAQNKPTSQITNLCKENIWKHETYVFLVFPKVGSLFGIGILFRDFEPKAVSNKRVWYPRVGSS